MVSVMFFRQQVMIFLGALAAFLLPDFILIYFLELDAYFSFTLAFTISMVFLYTYNNKLVASGSVRYLGDYLLFSTISYLITVLLTAIVWISEGPVLFWSGLFVGMVVLLGIVMFSPLNAHYS